MFEKHHEKDKETHGRKEVKPVSIAEWASKNDIDLAAVKPVFDVLVAKVNDLDTAIQQYHTNHFTAPPVTEDPKLAEDKAIQQGRHAEYLASVKEPGVNVNSAQEFAAIEQASRNLRTEIQSLVVK